VTVAYLKKVRELAGDPEQLELAYQEAVKAGEGDAFAEALHAAHAEAGDNLLFAAWHYRLLHAAARAARRVIAWSWAVPLAVINGLLLWLVSDEQRYVLQITNPFSGYQDQSATTPVVLLASPITAALIVVFLAGAGDRRWRRVLAIALALAGLTAYVLLVYPQTGTRVYQEQYLALMPMNLALLSWASIGVYALAGHWDAGNRFAFLLKSLEYVVVAGLFGIILALFAAVTFGLFSALGIEPPDAIVRLFVAGGAGLVAVLAVALVVEPGVAPRRQSFDDGPSRLVTLLLRLMLPLALVVLTVFLVFIPANSREPFENRDVLIAFNAMLFAVVALLVGVVPLDRGDLSQRLRIWLRRGVVALAALALIVGVYALAAIVYRTVDDRLTPNRLTFIGWNVINIGVLVWLLILQWRSDRSEWLGALHRSLTDSMLPYAAWALLTLLALPWLFAIDKGEVHVADLPDEIQHLVGEEPYPILLKCPTSPHVYLLDGGQKRWIRDIPTFEAEGFKWRDVKFETCEDIDAVPDGEPIPPDAGSPPGP
jgi:hypothetical protein